MTLCYFIFNFLYNYSYLSQKNTCDSLNSDMYTRTFFDIILQQTNQQYLKNPFFYWPSRQFLIHNKSVIIYICTVIKGPSQKPLSVQTNTHCTKHCIWYEITHTINPNPTENKQKQPHSLSLTLTGIIHWCCVTVVFTLFLLNTDIQSQSTGQLSQPPVSSIVSAENDSISSKPSEFHSIVNNQ